MNGIFIKPKPGIKILGSSTVDRMTDIMTEVVNSGTAKKTQIAGIKIAGKTGTTKKIGANGSIRQYVPSFGGFFPADNPKVALFVVIDDPKGNYYGGDVAAPLFKSIAEKLLLYFKIFPKLDDNSEIRI
jgi:stage V sporulation protein D (sporulation-specific penicillin-binding protein)